MKLAEAIEEIEDITEVVTNLDMPEDLIARYESEAA